RTIFRIPIRSRQPRRIRQGTPASTTYPRRILSWPSTSSHATDGARARSATLSQATAFRLSHRLGLVFTLLRPSPRNGVIGTGTQINKNVVEITHDIGIGTEPRHDALLRRVHILAPIDHHVGEIRKAERLQRIAERRGVGRPFAVRAVTHVAIRVIAAKAGIGGPIHRAVALNLVSRIAFL